MAGSNTDGGLGLGYLLRRGMSMLMIIKMHIFQSRLERMEDSTPLKGKVISSSVPLPPNMEPGWGERKGSGGKA